MLRKMFGKSIKLIITGISMGCTISCIIMMVGTHFSGSDWILNAPKGFTAQIIGAMLTGIGFSLPSLIYEKEQLSRAQQSLIHLGTGFLIYLIIAYYLQWLPTQNTAILLLSILFMAVCTILIWLCFYFYYKSEAKAINKKLTAQNPDTRS